MIIVHRFHIEPNKEQEQKLFQTLTFAVGFIVTEAAFPQEERFKQPKES